MDVGAALVADGQPAEAIQPRQRTFHYPAVPTQPLAGFDAFTGNTAFDAAPSKVSAAVTRIVGFIGVEFFRPPTRATKATLDGRDRVQQGLENRAIMLVCPRDFHGQGDALALDDHVALGTRFTPIGRVGPGERPALLGRHAAA